MKKVLFVCGTGGITSAVAEKQAVDACKEAGVPIFAIRCKPTEMTTYLDNIDFIVSTTAIGDNYPVPVVHALPLIIGVGKEAVLSEIVALAKKEDAE